MTCIQKYKAAQKILLFPFILHYYMLLEPEILNPMHSPLETEKLRMVGCRETSSDLTL
jgi:hypothetical protein